MEPISNEIFETYTIRERANEQVKAIKLLARQGYTVIDLEGYIINKSNYNKKEKFNLEYKRSSNYRIPKLQKQT
jgi:hypothetical protein|tara:strand:- start:277 stop:498 length:222 start_codon:yes stop_codon:yes gene_type:complete